MKEYLIKRVFLGIGIIFAISIITFFVLNIIPGDPVALILGEFADKKTADELRAVMRLDRPAAERYFEWLMELLSGNLGTSYFQKKPVIDLIIYAFGFTATLAVCAYLVALAVGLAAGITAAVNHGKWIDNVLMTLSFVGISAPAFWVAILLQIYIGLNFKAFPISGAEKPISYVLPSLALGVRYAASIARIARSSMLDVLGQEYIRVAQAKGLKKGRIIMVHALKNALVPIITVIGTDIGSLLTGAMITESVFNIPGIGKLLFDAIRRRDLPIVQGCVVYTAALCVVIYIAVDIIYAWIDPRIRLEKEDA